jgi:hypothetical protein
VTPAYSQSPLGKKGSPKEGDLSSGTAE